MAVNEAILTALFVMAVVFSVLIVLSVVLTLFSFVMKKVNGMVDKKNNKTA